MPVVYAYSVVYHIVYAALCARRDTWKPALRYDIATLYNNNNNNIIIVYIPIPVYNNICVMKRRE